MTHVFRLLTVSTAAALWAVGAGQGLAAQIGVNFHSAEDGGNGVIESGPAGYVPQNNWNNTEGASGSIAAGSVLDSSGGVSSGVAVDWWSVAQSGHGGLMDGTETGHQELFGGSLDPRNGSTIADTPVGETDSAVIQVSGLGAPYTTNGYSLYVYFDGNSGSDNRVAHFRLDPNGDGDLSDQQDRYGADKAGVHFQETETYALTTETTDPGFGLLVPSTNTAVFSNLTDPDFILEAVPDGSASSAALRSNIMGFQIVAIPEPASAVLVAVLGVVAAPLRRR